MNANWIHIDKAIADFEDFGDEVVVIDSRSGVFYSLKGRSTSLWRAFVSGIARSDIDARLADADPADAATIEKMLSAMLESGLLISSETEQGNGVIEDWDKIGTAIFEQNEDFDDLIKLDPIHDVGDKGWPYKTDKS